MRFSSTAAALVGCCASAYAFSDSTPFVLFSTSPTLATADSEHAQLQSSSQAISQAKKLLSSCPTNRYLVVSQPNLNAGHLATRENVPHFRQAFGKASARFSIAEVAGGVDVRDLSNYIRETCQGQKVETVELEALALPPNTKTLGPNDDHLGIMLGQYEMEDSYTVIYTGAPQVETFQSYTPEFLETIQANVKRQLHSFGKRANVSDDLPLFEKYQFLTPAIFMGLLAFVILISILYAGLGAVASLEIPYGAFEKDMGPAAQKKQQ